MIELRVFVKFSADPKEVRPIKIIKATSVMTNMVITMINMTMTMDKMMTMSEEDGNHNHNLSPGTKSDVRCQMSDEHDNE